MTRKEQTPLPEQAFLHLPGFLPEPEARRAFDALRAELPWRQDAIVLFGRRVRQPRLVVFCADEGVTYAYSGHTPPRGAWTPTLAALRRLVEDAGGVAFNSVLCNLYRDGADSMGWHADDEPSLGPRPVLASLSLGGARRFLVRHRSTKATSELLLESGSLLVMSGPSQDEWLHCVPKTPKPCAPRINLTFRRVVRRSPGARVLP